MHKQSGDYYHTGVMFRTFPKGDTIALLTETFHDGSCIRGACMSYQHVGQHGEADPRHVVAITRPATTEESDALKYELRNIGYRFTKIYQRFPYKRTNARA